MQKTFKNIPVNQFSYIVSELDENNDDRISLEEFINYIRKERFAETTI